MNAGDAISPQTLSLVLTAIVAVASGLWALFRRRGDVELKAADLDLAWAERAESLWAKMRSAEEEMERLRREIQTVNSLVLRLRDEVTSLREAIRDARDLDELKRQEQQIPSAATLPISSSANGRS